MTLPGFYINQAILFWRYQSHLNLRIVNMFDLKQSPLYFVPLETGHIMLLLLTITILDAVINYWKNCNVKANIITTPVPVAFEYSPLGESEYWSCGESEQIDQDTETPIQRIHGMKFLRLEHRAKLMPGVRRRLDQHF